MNARAIKNCRRYTAGMSLFATVILWVAVLAAIKHWQYDVATAAILIINAAGLTGVLLAFCCTA